MLLARVDGVPAASARGLLKSRRRGIGVQRHAEGRIVRQRTYRIGDGLIEEEPIAGADGSLAVLERVPHDAEARAEVLVVGFIDLLQAVCAHANERVSRRSEDYEAIEQLLGCGVHIPAQADLDAQVRPQLVTV